MITMVVWSLQGCWPAAFVAGAATGIVVYDHRPAKVIASDKNVSIKIQGRLNGDEELLRDAHVTVATFNRIVLLVGQAPDEELRSRAEGLARTDSRIKKVYNEVTLDNPAGKRARTRDSWLTAKVKTALMTTPGLNSASLKVVTEGRVVYLMGLTSKAQGDVAAEKARSVTGVKKVVKLFEYLN